MQPGTGIAFSIGGQEAEIDKIGMADLVAFERQFGLGAASLTPPPLYDEDGSVVLDEETGEPVPDARAVRLEWVAFLVWRSARRQGLIAKDIAFDDDFLESIDDIDMDAVPALPVQEDGVDPSKAAQLTS